MTANPDMIFTRKRVAIFFDGCYWHGCTRCHDIDRDLNEYWQCKIRKNVDRDRRVTRQLTSEGWTVVRVREHELKTKDDFKAVVDRLKGVLNANGEKRDF